MIYDVEELQYLLKSLIRKGELELGVKFVEKSSSRLMRFIYVVSLMKWWNPNFMTGYATTIGSTIYLPRKLETYMVGSVHALSLFSHELQHIADSRAYRPLAFWSFLYLWPQSMAALSLLAFFHPAWLLFLVCAAPWPAPFRVWAEIRGYARGLATRARMGFPVDANTLDGYEKRFTGWGYYRMAWHWEPTRERLRKTFLEFLSGAN